MKRSVKRSARRLAPRDAGPWAKLDAKFGKNARFWTCAVLAVAFLASVILRFHFSDFLKKMTIYPDESLYFPIAKSLASGQGISVYHTPVQFQKILYSLVIAPAFWAKDTEMQVRLIALINSIVLSSGILPAYLLSRRIVARRSSALFIALSYLFLPDLMGSMTFMAETLSLPLGTWTIYLFLRMIGSSSRKQELFNGICFSVVIYLLFLTKEVALVFLPAYALYLILELFLFPDPRTTSVRDKLSWAALRLAVVLGPFLLLTITASLTIFHAGASVISYQGSVSAGFSLMSQPGQLRYVLYATAYFTTSFLISVGILPVLLPLLHFHELPLRSKRLYTFLTSLLLTSAGVVAWTIAIREDFDSLTPVAHLRYINYLPIPFLAGLLSLCQRRWGLAEKSRRVTIAVPCALTLFLMLFYRGTENRGSSCLAQPGLGYFFHITTDQVLLACAILGILALAGMLIFYKKRRLLPLPFFAIAAVVAIYNNVAFYQRYLPSYSLADDIYASMAEVAEQIRAEPDKTFLLVAEYGETGQVHGSQAMIETYASEPNLLVTSASWITGAQDETGVALPAQAPTFQFGGTYDLDHVDYVLLHTDFALLDTATAEMVAQMPEHTLYRLKDPSRLPAIYQWWVLHEGVNSFPFDQAHFYTEDDEAPFVSDEEPQYLVGGPLRSLPPGYYRFTLHYDYAGDLPAGTPLGTIDVRSEALGRSSLQIDIPAGEDVVALECLLEEGCPDVDFRVYTEYAGITAKSLDIEKLS